MAKVSDFKFDIKGEQFCVHVNCNSSGTFNANVPAKVSEALRINEKISADTLAELSSKFYGALDKYKNSQITEELFILIAYYARGNYATNEKGLPLFGGYNHKYHLEVNFSRPKNAIGLDFMVAIKETIDGKEKWFEAKLGKTFAFFQKEEYSQPEIYHRHGTIHNPNQYKIIPYSKEALESLQNAEEKIRSASEALYNFIEQDEKLIELTLTKTKLLSA